MDKEINEWLDKNLKISKHSLLKDPLSNIYSFYLTVPLFKIQKEISTLFSDVFF